MAEVGNKITITELDVRRIAHLFAIELYKTDPIRLNRDGERILWGKLEGARMKPAVILAPDGKRFSVGVPSQPPNTDTRGYMFDQLINDIAPSKLDTIRANIREYTKIKPKKGNIGPSSKFKDGVAEIGYDVLYLIKKEIEDVSRGI